MTTFDWVTKRNSCSLVKVFEILKLEVQQDVETRNSLRPPGASYKFNIVVKPQTFTVYLESNNPHWAIKFGLVEKAIEVRDENDKLILMATPTLSDDGECKLQVGGQERDFWQVRKMALEKFFFSV